MRLSFSLAVSLLVICPQAVVAQTDPDADALRYIQELQASHIQANVPDDKTFPRLLERDLIAYFSAQGLRRPTVKFELLRRTATQTGISYPKFYLWVRVQSAGGQSTSGALRVAAIERRRFEVTNFLSAPEIKDDPRRAESIFPTSLVSAIIERAAGS